MYDSIDLMELKEIERIALDVPESHFTMRCYITSRTNVCGAVGCLIGHWAIRNNHQSILEAVETDNVRFCGAPLLGMTDAQYRFLFEYHDDLPRYRARNARDLTKDQAISRLRKYVAYIERKRALFAEHDWMMSLSRADRRARLLGPRKAEMQTAGSGANQ